MCTRPLLLVFSMGLACSLPSAADAKTKAEISILDIEYTDVLPLSECPRLEAYADAKSWEYAFCALGEGMIDCNGVTACEDAGQDGQPAYLQQGFLLEVGSVEEGLAGFSVYTAGRLGIPGESVELLFKGKGDGLFECSEGTCDLAIELYAKTTHGGKLTFSLLKADIDADGAGFELRAMGGYASLIRQIGHDVANLE